MALSALMLFTASVVHFGLRVPLGVITVRDPYSGAAIPEAVIGGILGAGALSVLARWRHGWRIALGTTAFCVLGVVFGLSITLRSGRIGDVAYHVSLLTVLLVTTGLLLVQRPNR